MTKPTSISIDEADLERLEAVCLRLHLPRSRVYSIGLNLLHSLMELNCREVVEPLTYDQVVLSPEGGRRAKVKEREPAAPRKKKKKKKVGWPKGRKRGPWPEDRRLARRRPAVEQQPPEAEQHPQPLLRVVK